ncbi:hypothetical protein [Halomonas sp. H10-9-1]|uniref:hypothetical protein n=1 Tax=Halomonas sp. H10-9-1 TaxID=2950871 RepID=UPI0032DF164A
MTTTVTCTAREPNGKVDFPYEIKNQYVSINCRRDDAEEIVRAGNSYDILPRGTITIQTAGKPFQLFFAEEYNPPAPLNELQRVEREIVRRSIPVGTIVSSALTPGQFSSPENPQYDSGVWVPANGEPLPPDTKYEELTGSSVAPNMTAASNAQYVQQILTSNSSNKENVTSLIDEESSGSSEWSWFISGRNIQGSRYNADWEQAVDQIQSYIAEDGTVTAQGRTHNFKHNRWGEWSSGSANVLGIETQGLPIFYYVKVN